METTNNIASIDIGNLTTVVETEKKSQIFESRLSKATDIQQLSEQLITFQKQGETFAVGEGEFENNLFKYDKANFIDLLHYGIANNMKSGNVKLVTCIPANQYNSFKDELKNKIMQNNKIDLVINNKHKKILIEECAILPEGYPIFKSIKKEMLLPNTKSVVADIGGGTVDLSYFDENGRFIDGDSIDIGLLDLYKTVQDKLMNSFKTYKSIEEAKEFYRGNLNFFTVNDPQDTVRKESTKEIFDQLYNKILAKRKDLKEVNLIIAGGGAEVFGSMFKQLIPQTIIDCDITTTAKAAYAMGVSKWLKRK